MQQREISLNHIKGELLSRNEILAEGTRTSLLGLEALLRQIGREVVDLNVLEDSNHGKGYFERLNGSNLRVFGYAFARPDGQFILMTGLNPGDKMPNILKRPQSAKSFQRALDLPSIQLAPPYLQDYDGDKVAQWIIPARLAIKDDRGQTKGVISSALGITAEGTVWYRLTKKQEEISKKRHLNAEWKHPYSLGLSEPVSFVVHKDGYTQYSGCSLKNQETMKAIYTEPFPQKIMDKLKEIHKRYAYYNWETKGINKYTCQNKNLNYITTSEYLPDFGLYVITALPFKSWEMAFYNNLTPQAIMCGLLLTFTFFGHIYITHQQRKHEEKIVYLARHDALTGLPNQNQLLDRMLSLVAIASRDHSKCALLVLKINNLTLINQTKGIKFGNACIQAIPERMKKAIRSGDILARTGTETFALFFPSINCEEEALETARRVLAILSTPVIIETKEARMAGKIGISLSPDDAQSGEGLLNAASLACDEAKKHPTQSIVTYNPTIDSNASRRAILENELKNAVADKQIEVFYQPKIDTTTGTCHQFEALARWRSDTFGAVSPDEFISIAEEAGLIDDLGLHVLDTALKDMIHIKETCNIVPHIAVNVSAKQFFTLYLPDVISGALSRHNVPGDWLTIELTESLMIIDKQHVAEVLTNIRKLGIGISIDDFGTGYSSLSYIHKLPMTELKIDRAFVTDIGNDKDNYKLVQSIIALGKSLNVNVVAEGVETSEHVEILTTLGCDQLQGYFFSPPRPIAELKTFIKTHSENNS